MGGEKRTGIIMNIHLKPPHYHGSVDLNRSVFLAGSISHAHDWQFYLAERILPYFSVINPRRDSYDTLDPKAEEEQITWEYNFLRKVKYVIFFFSYETVAPITLLEYGCFLSEVANGREVDIFTAIHPEYKRKNDVIIQTRLRAPQLSHRICFDLDTCLHRFIHHIKSV